MTIGGFAVANITSASDIEVVVILADVVAAGDAKDILLTSDTGAIVSRASVFTYLAPAVITAVDPGTITYLISRAKHPFSFHRKI